MTTQTPDIAEAARLWVIRGQDAAFSDWDGLAGWLEQDPFHLAAYEAALDDDAWIGDLYQNAPSPLTATLTTLRVMQQPRPQRRRWYAMGGAVAAALVAAITLSFGDHSQEIVTAPGEHRTIPLADGSRIILNGGTRITIDRDAPREVELASGEALFEVRHDESKPFVVTVGKTRLLDAGTVFNVVSDGDALDVAVAEGAVIYQPGASEIRLAPGDALSRSDGAARPVLRKASAHAIGGWRSGQLEYSNASLDQVARDLSRNLGQSVRTAGGAERLRFTGTLAIAGKPNEVLKRTGPLLGVNIAADGGDGWTMTPADGASPF